ncbi:hypothetical protein N0V90_010297 [Kalmusia sp. IMI 367209]|nr:hypothetical protein N0V90_010297 [Kalmusia sp. IMI 367209]
MPGRSIPRVRSCLRPPSSFTRSKCRAYSVKVLRGDDLGPIEQDDYQSYRLREGGKRLPLPPILDPLVVAQRSRWQQKKAKPDVNKFTPFQKKLWENPYARRPPPHPHPSNPDLWLLPLSLTTNKKHLGVPYRFLAHKAVAAHLTHKRHWEKSLYQRFIEKYSRKQREGMVWREDMPELIQTLLQKRVVDKLAWWFKWRGRLVAVRSPLPQDLEEIEDVSCVILLGSLKTSADKLLQEVDDIVADVDKWSVYFAKGFAKDLDPHKKDGVTHPAPSW